MIDMKEIKVLRSRRKSVGISIESDGSILVKAPYLMSDDEIQEVIRKHQRWIENHQARRASEQEQLQQVDLLTMEEIRQLAEQAMKVIPERVAYYAPKVGVTYGRITIRNQKSRWGSCSAKGNLNFNCLLMLTPPEVIDSVVVHELCHRKEMNHSERFYREVLRVFPDYWECDQWLKKNGSLLMCRMTG